MSSKNKNTFRITISNKKMTIDLLVIEISKTDDLKNFKILSEISTLKNIPIPNFVKKIFEKLH